MALVRRLLALRGVSPNRLRNIRLKYETSEKPDRNAISAICFRGYRVSANNAKARSNRNSLRCSENVEPVVSISR
jgi:hypothetical protein